MAEIKVHGFPASTATVMVLCCLNEKQVQYELVLVDLPAGAHKQPQYLPFGVVPTIQGGDLTLFESRAILRYLAKKFKGQGTDLLGSTPSEEALVDQWCEVEGQSFNPSASSIVSQFLLAPAGGSKDEAAVEMNPEKLGKVLDIYQERLSKSKNSAGDVFSLTEKLGKVLDIYEERLSKSKYLAGDFFSLADLQHLPYTHYLVNACGKGDLISSRKHVNARWEDISGRPTWKKVAENMKFN